MNIDLQLLNMIEALAARVDELEVQYAKLADKVYGESEEHPGWIATFGKNKHGKIGLIKVRKNHSR